MVPVALIGSGVFLCVFSNPLKSLDRILVILSFQIGPKNHVSH